MAGNLPTVVDDDGSGTTGTIINKAIWDQVFVPWTDIAFDAGNFTGNNLMTWTVGSGDQTTLAYAIAGDIITLTFALDTTSISGTPSTELRITLPFSSAGKQFNGTFTYSDNGASFALGVMQINAGSSALRLFKPAITDWTASTNNTSVYGQISYQKA